MNDCITNPPTEPGRYNVTIKGIMSVAAIFWDFDGTHWDTDGWLDKPLKAGDAHWFPNRMK